MRKILSKERPVVVPPEVLLEAGLSLADLGLYVKVEYLLEERSRQVGVDDLVQELLDGKAGVIAHATAQDLRAGIDRLVAAELYDL